MASGKGLHREEPLVGPKAPFLQKKCSVPTTARVRMVQPSLPELNIPWFINCSCASDQHLLWPCVTVCSFSRRHPSDPGHNNTS